LTLGGADFFITAGFKCLKAKTSAINLRFGCLIRFLEIVTSSFNHSILPSVGIILTLLQVLELLECNHFKLLLLDGFIDLLSPFIEQSTIFYQFLKAQLLAFDERRVAQGEGLMEVFGCGA
jgi:hypothetical protein